MTTQCLRLSLLRSPRSCRIKVGMSRMTTAPRTTTMKTRPTYPVTEADTRSSGAHVFLILLDVSSLTLIVNSFLSWFSLDTSIFSTSPRVDEFSQKAIWSSSSHGHGHIWTSVVAKYVTKQIIFDYQKCDSNKKDNVSIHGHVTRIKYIHCMFTWA